jgi:hypothetical protein
MSRVNQNTSGQGAQPTKSDAAPLKWMAPDSIKNKEYSYKSDVCSYRVVIAEVLTRYTEPYHDLEPIQGSPTKICAHRCRPAHRRRYRMLLHACSERQPENRPTRQEIVGFFSWECSSDSPPIPCHNGEKQTLKDGQRNGPSSNRRGSMSRSSRQRAKVSEREGKGVVGRPRGRGGQPECPTSPSPEGGCLQSPDVPPRPARGEGGGGSWGHAACSGS